MKNIILIIVLIVYSTGCKGDPGPAGPTMYGDIAGNIFLYSDNGQVLKDNSGVTITLDGRQYSTQSLPNGTWKLSGVPAGIYDIVFSKPGYITYKEYGVQFVGGGTLFLYYRIWLSQIPPTTIIEFKLTQSSNNTSVFAKGKISSADSLNRTIRILFSKTPFSLSATINFLFSQYVGVPADSTSFSSVFAFNEDYKTSYELSSGSTLYALAFAAPRGGGFYYNYNPFANSYEMYTTGLVFSNSQVIIVP